jgi:hypothetical protein
VYNREPPGKVRPVERHSEEEAQGRDRAVDARRPHASLRRCSWNRRRSSAVAVSGDRPSSYLAVGAGAGSEEDRTHRERRQITAAWAEGRLCRQLKRSDRQHTSRHDQQQPPHVQAKNTYVEYLDEVGGRRFLVTMEEPSVAKPQPIVFEISGAAASWL